MDYTMSQYFETEVLGYVDECPPPSPSQVFEGLYLDGDDGHMPDYPHDLDPVDFDPLDAVSFLSEEASLPCGEQLLADNTPNSNDSEPFDEEHLASLLMKALEEEDEEENRGSEHSGLETTNSTTVANPEDSMNSSQPTVISSDADDENNGIEQFGAGIVEYDEFVKCKKCATMTSMPFYFRKKGKSTIFNELMAPESRKSEPYCLACAESLVKYWCRNVNRFRLAFRECSPESQRDKVAALLSNFGNLKERLFLADHYLFCRGCLDVKARVELPGETCESCRGRPQCASCGRCVRALREVGDRLMCAICRADPKEAGRHRVCIRCNAPATRYIKPWIVFCEPCGTHVSALPGTKCTLCDFQPRAINHKTCDECRAWRRYYYCYHGTNQSITLEGSVADKNK